MRRLVPRQSARWQLALDGSKLAGTQSTYRPSPILNSPILRKRGTGETRQPPTCRLAISGSTVSISRRALRAADIVPAVQAPKRRLLRRKCRRN